MKHFLFVILYTVFLTHANAQAIRYHIDKKNSTIGHEIGFLGFTSLVANANNYQGYIDYDRREPTNSRLDFRIKSSSIHHDNQLIDDYLHGEYFLDSKNYPWLIFKSKEVRFINPKVMLIKGTLTIKGIKQQALIQAHLKNISIDSSEVSFTGGLYINRNYFNLGFGYPIIGKEIITHFDVTGNTQ